MEDLRVQAQLREADVLRWHRRVAVIAASLFFLAAAYSVWVSYREPSQLDFVNLWAAAKLAIEGNAALAYHPDAHHAAMSAAGSVEGLSPFVHPPPFLLALMPFGLLSFPVAMIVWLVCTSGFYLFSTRRITTLPIAIAQPAAIANPLNGQIGLLTSGLFVLGTSALARKPVVAGMILGLLVVKPQLAILIPVALLGGREWGAIGGAALSALAVVLGSLFLFGADAYQSFLFLVPHHADLLRKGSWAWFQLASPFAAFRAIGVAHLPALHLHGLLAIAAGAITWRAWTIRHTYRTELLAAATVLISPYLFIYDTLLLILPFAALLHQRRPFESAAVWILCTVPMLGYAGLYDGPNTTPFAAMLSIWALYGRTHSMPGDNRGN